METQSGKCFLQATYYPNLAPSDQMRGLPPPRLELERDHQGSAIDLPPPSSIDSRVTLQQAIARRSSVRRYAPHPLNLQELSFLLWATQGVKRVIPGQATLRTVPSAGARHALETYLLVNRVSGLDAGLFRFLASDHRILPIESDPQASDRFTEACFGQSQVRESAVTFVWLSEVQRMTWRYGERGYRYLFLDAGHVCQNLYLAAEAVAAGVCAIAAFDDQKINALLHCDGEKRFVIYLATVGKK